MATNAHGIFGFAGFGIAFDLLGKAGSRHAGDNYSEYRGEQLIHFARTIR
ncbi:MAG: hypothetical protein MUP33_07460 [Polaromonas sp.]|nr:hypothetical protein [Polaromonas sp.]